MGMEQVFSYFLLGILFIFGLMIIYVFTQVGATVVNIMQYTYNELAQGLNGTNGIYYTYDNASAYTGLNTTNWQPALQNAFNAFFSPVALGIYLAIFIALFIWTWRRG